MRKDPPRAPPGSGEITMKIVSACKAAGLRMAADEVERRRRRAPNGSVTERELMDLRGWLIGQAAVAEAAT